MIAIAIICNNIPKITISVALNIKMPDITVAKLNKDKIKANNLMVLVFYVFWLRNRDQTLNLFWTSLNL
jgi:hypothetical protein